MYRPTVRYAEAFREYVDQLFQATTLDRNQILRGALFAAAHSQEFQELLKTYWKGDVPPSDPSWSCQDHHLWMEQNPQHGEEGKDVNANDTRAREDEKTSGTSERGTSRGEEKETGIRRLESYTRRERKIPPRIDVQGGITIKVGEGFQIG